MVIKALVSGVLLLFAGSFYTNNGLAKDGCTYQVKEDSAKLTWTGYKFTEKFGVSGTFEGVGFSQNKAAKSPDELFKSIQFTVETASMDSGMPIRDKKLVLFLFGGLVDSGKISGKVVSFDAGKKTAVAEIQMNGKSLKKEFQVSVSGDSYSFVSEIDLSDFGMNGSVQKLASACKDLHTGGDGKSKTWSLVGLKVEATAVKSCK